MKWFCLLLLLISCVANAETVTFTPSADVYITGESDVDMAAVRLLTSGTVTENGDLLVSAYRESESNIYRLSRSFLVFDTSALPDNAIITSASISFKFQSVDDAFGEAFYRIYTSTCADTPVSGDFDLFGSLVSGTGTYSSTALVTLSLTDTSNINLTGKTKYCARQHFDYTAADPEDGVGYSGPFYDVRAATVADRPTLTVTYTVPSSFFAPFVAIGDFLAF